MTNTLINKSTKASKLLGGIASVLLLSATLVACGQNTQTSAPTDSKTAIGTKKVKIGITQIVEHPSLNRAREGFMDGMKAGGYGDDKVTYDFKVAQGNQDTSLQIAQKFAGDQVDMILAITTPSAQHAAQATKQIPILFTAVTDPVAAKLVKSLQNGDGNITGTTDMNPVKEQMELIKKLAPNVTKVGIVYNSGEVNSEVQVKAAEEAAKTLGLEVVKVAISNSTEVKQAAESLVGKVQAFYVPTDNMVVSALSSMVQVAEKNKLPMIAGEGDTVKQGALATYSIDYYQLGKQTAEMAIKVLKGEKPGNLPVESQKEYKLVINLKEAKAIGLEIPKDLLDKAVKVE